MISYDYYKNTFKGQLEEIEFNELEAGVCRLLDGYIKTLMPYWRAMPLHMYGIDFNDIICTQIDFIADNGGKSALQGNSDFNITGVSTKGFRYSAKKMGPMFSGVPISPLMDAELKYYLRSKGFMTRRFI